MAELKIEFTDALWEYQGDAPWVFVTLPAYWSEEIKARVPGRRGFGSVKVVAVIGGSRWETSVFPDKGSGSFVLPVKKAIRDQECLGAGDTASVILYVALD